MWMTELNFFDVHTPNPLLQKPFLHHFRSTTMGDVDMYLLTKWEKCLDEEIKLPAHIIRTYGTHTIIRPSHLFSADVHVDHLSNTASSETYQPQPCTPCSSQDSSQPRQTETSLLCTPSSSQDSSQPRQTETSLLCTPCSPQDSSQPRQTETSLLCTPCSSQHSSQPRQTETSLLCTPCSSHGTTLTSKQ